MAYNIFIIAGEASGDWLGAKLIREMKTLAPDAVFYGIGGQKMAAEGIQSIFPMQEISIMGFAEIVPHLPNLIKRLKQTEQKIRDIKPDIVVTIDSPGFNFRIISKLQDLRPAIKFVHYVAPTVWAYKPERAAKIAKLFDHLLVLLPFEPPYFETEGLATTFIGHPVIEDGLGKGDGDGFKAKYKLDNFILMMPGSRRGELKRNLPIFKKVAESMGQNIVIIAADNARALIEPHVKGWNVKTLIVDNSEKADCFAACTAGVIKSGTSGLEFAFAGKPYVVAYKVSPLTAWFLRRIIKIPYVNLINILADEPLVPELIQEECTPEKIITALKSEIRTADISEYAKNIAKLIPANGTPSANAAEKIVELLDRS